MDCLVTVASSPRRCAVKKGQPSSAIRSLTERFQVSWENDWQNLQQNHQQIIANQGHFEAPRLPNRSGPCSDQSDQASQPGEQVPQLKS